MKLVSLDDVKLFLEKTDEEHDELLEMLIEFCSKRIEGFTNRKFAISKYTEIFDSYNGRRRCFLSALPIVRGSNYPINVFIDGVLKQEDLDYVVWEEMGVVDLLMPVYNSKIKIEYYGGYSLNNDGIVNVPDDIKYACLLQIAHDFRTRDTSGLQSMTLPNGSVTFRPDSMLPHVKQILKQYRLKPT